MLAQQFIDSYKNQFKFILCGRQFHDDIYLSLSDFEFFHFNIPTNVTHAIIFAGITNISYCQDHPISAAVVNRDSTISLIRLLNQNGQLSFLSSSCVFANQAEFTSGFHANNLILSMGC